jgi:hypothetical protein
VKVRVSNQCATALTEQLRHEHASIRHNKHWPDYLRKSNNSASSSSVIPVS